MHNTMHDVGQSCLLMLRLMLALWPFWVTGAAIAAIHVAFQYAENKANRDRGTDRNGGRR